MKKLFQILGTLTLIFVFSFSVSQAATTLFPGGGGTGWGYPGGIKAHTVMLGNGTSPFSTTSPSTSGYVLTSNGVNADPTFQAATGGGSGNVSTSSSETAGYLPYWTSTSATPATLGKIATSSVSNGTGISFTGTAGSLVGGTNLTITNSSPLSGLSAAFPFSFSDPTLSWVGLATSTNLTKGYLLYATGVKTIGQVATSTLSASSPLTGSFTQIGSGGSLGCQTASGSQAGCLSSTDWTTFNNKGSGTVTSVAAGVGLNGGTITSSGTLSLKSYIATSSAETKGQLAYWTSTSATPATLGKVATSSVTYGLGFTKGGTFGALVGGSSPTLSIATSSLYSGATGGVPYFTSKNTLGALSAGTNGYVMELSAGVPKWVATTTLSTISGILSVAHGGTGWAALQSNSVLLGNGSSAVSTTSAGTNGYVLALKAGVPSWVATTTLSTITGTLATGNGGTGTTTWFTNAVPYYGGSHMNESLGLQYNGSKLTTTYASSTAISATTICISSTCKTAWPAGGTNYWNLSSNKLYNNIGLYTGIGSSSPSSTLAVDASSTSPTLNSIFSVGYKSGSTEHSILTVASSSAAKLGIGTSSPYAPLSVVGQIVGAYFSATTTTHSTFPYASSTALTISGNSYVGTVKTGTWNGSAIGILYGGTATTTGNTNGVTYYDGSKLTENPTKLSFTGTNFGVGSSTPFYRFSVGTIGSQLGVNSSGFISVGASQPATSSPQTIDWTGTPQQVEIRIGTGAITIELINATTSGEWGSVKRVWVCNPNAGTAGTITWKGVEWIGTAPTQTTTAKKCDLYGFDVTHATSTTAYKVAGQAGTGFP